MDQALTGHPPYSSRGNVSNRTIDYSSLNKEEWAREANNVMSLCQDLIDDNRYMPFFFKRLYAIGPTAFLAAADEARKKGFKKGRTFTNLIKEPSLRG